MHTRIFGNNVPVYNDNYIAFKIPNPILESMSAAYKFDDSLVDSFGGKDLSGSLSYDTGFNGNTLALSVGSASTSELIFDNLGATFGFSFWVKYDSSGCPVGIDFLRLADNTQSFYLRWKYSSSIQFEIVGNTVQSTFAQSPSSGPTFHDSWMFYYFSFTNRTLDVWSGYVNSGLPSPYLFKVYDSGAYQFTFNSTVPTEKLTIEVYKDVSTKIKIDELSFWNEELTEAQISELFNNGNGSFYPY